MSEAPASTPATSRLHLGRLGQITFWMMLAVLASRLIGYLRNAYIAYAFGAGRGVDAYVAAFTLPNWLNYLAAGGTLSITFITIFTVFLQEHREAEGYRVFSTVVNFLTLFLLAGIVAAEIWTAPLLHWYLPAFTPGQLALCARMTRILLPAQLFFCIGGVLSAVLYSRGKFFLPAVAPLIYGAAIILGGILLRGRYGITSLAVGALIGAFLGPFLLPLLGALGSGLRYRWSLNLRHPAFVRWLKLTLPLMIGVTLVTADDWIMQPLGAHFPGVISQLYFAKRLMNVPIAVLGQAVGQAGMPFFAALYTAGHWREFRETLDQTIWRTAAGSILVSSWFVALSLPLIQFVYRHGAFNALDARRTALYFAVFALSLVCWSVQNLYARAFYASGNTLIPMVAGTLVTLAAIPIYIVLSHHWTALGLAIASDIGITLHTLVLAFLLKSRRLLGFSSRWRQLPRLLLLAVAAGGGAAVVSHWLFPRPGGAFQALLALAAGTLVWGGIAWVLARLLGLHGLLAQIRKLSARFGLRLGSLSPRAPDA